VSRYLNEIRLGKQKQFFRDIIHDVRNQFNLRPQKRPVPHITLFGPYDTSQGYKAKYRTQRVLSNHSVVPFRVEGFSSFPDAGVVYADVQPSKQLRDLRRELASALIPITYEYQSWDTDDTYDFHITIAMNLGRKRTNVLTYLRQNYDVDMRLYTQRVAVLDRRQMMWEWDIPRGTELSAQEATSRGSWQKTSAALTRRKEATGSEGRTRKQALLSRLLPWKS
jgi:2'-5' RNA ligase